MARAAGSQRSWWVLAGLAGLAWGQACTGGGDDTGEPGLPIGDLLADVGPQVMLPALDAFLADLAALEDALAHWQAGTAEQLAVQTAWGIAMGSWQVLEVMGIGPAGDSLDVVGGADLRDEIYSWPTVNGCRVDQETTEEAWDDEDWFSDNLVNSYGLDALEHLLFATLENSCPTQTGIDDVWDALGEDGVLANRQAFARALTAGVTTVATDLRDRWATDGGDFSTGLTVTTEDSPYTSRTSALNAVFDAMFYLDTVTKDRKLAQPLGLLECSESRCPDDVEGLLSGTGAASIQANLDGFRALFTGGEGAGFDGLLAELGHGDLADAILAATDTALASAGRLDGPLDVLVVDSPVDVGQVHTDLKAVTDLLKGDLATVLVLSLPDEASGDND